MTFKSQHHSLDLLDLSQGIAGQYVRRDGSKHSRMALPAG